MIRFMREIETKYDVSSVTVNNIQVWPFLRSRYCYKHVGYFYNIKNNRKSFFQKIKRARNIFYGFRNFFGKYNYLIFTSTDQKRLKGNVYIDKLVENLVKELGENKTLLIEEPQNDIHINIKKISYRNIISHDLFHFFGEQYYLFNKRFLICNENILKEINEKNKLNVDYKTEISRFLRYVRYYKIFFNIYKPKAIFMIDYYSLSHQSAIFAANEMGIKTIELQHGIINKKHFAYNIFCKLDIKFFPNFLLSFGDYVKNVFTRDNYFISQKNIFPVGNEYIGYINKFYKVNSDLINIMKKFKKTVAITLQYTIEDKLIKFIKCAAKKDNSILYILIPRDLENDYLNKGFTNNIVILKKYDFYKIVKYVDFHITVNSTCALEAPAFGTPNILINIDDLAKNYYLDLLTNRDITRFVDDEKELINLILNWHTKSKEEIIDLHGNFYEPNNQKNIRNALKIILNSKLNN